MKSTSYITLSYDELPENIRRKALRHVKRRYREILADESKLIDLIRQQRTTFHDDGSLCELTGLQRFLITGEDKTPVGEVENVEEAES